MLIDNHSCLFYSRSMFISYFSTERKIMFVSQKYRKEGHQELDLSTIVKVMKLLTEVKAMHDLLPFTIITCYLLGCNLKIYAHWIWTSYKSQTCKPYIYKSDNTYHYCYWRCYKTKSHFRCKLRSYPNLYSCLNQLFWFCCKCRLSLWFKDFNE